MSANPLGPLVKVTRGIRDEVVRQAANETAALVLYNATGETLVYGDVVVQDTGNDQAVEFAGAAGAAVPMVVYQGGAAGQNVKCLNVGVLITITCDGGAVVRGDTIMASATARYGTVTTGGAGEAVLGVAMTAKGAGVGQVKILLMPGGGAGGGGEVTVVAGVTGRVTLAGSEYTIDSRVVVDTAAPGSPWTGMLWFDTDA